MGLKRPLRYWDLILYGLAYIAAGWMILLDYLLVRAVVYVLMAVALETLLPSLDRGAWIVLLITMTTAVNWFGISVTSRVNLISVVMQFIIFGGIHGLGRDGTTRRNGQRGAHAQTVVRPRLSQCPL